MVTRFIFRVLLSIFLWSSFFIFLKVSILSLCTSAGMLIFVENSLLHSSDFSSSNSICVSSSTSLMFWELWYRSWKVQFCCFRYWFQPSELFTQFWPILIWLAFLRDAFHKKKWQKYWHCANWNLPPPSRPNNDKWKSDKSLQSMLPSLLRKQWQIHVLMRFQKNSYLGERGALIVVICHFFSCHY